MTDFLLFVDLKVLILTIDGSLLKFINIPNVIADTLYTYQIMKEIDNISDWNNLHPSLVIAGCHISTKRSPYQIW